MRFNTLCASVALAGVASAVPGWFDAAGQDVIANDADKVPGTNPLTFCNADRSKDLVTIEKVDLNPNPPVPYVLLFSHLPSLHHPLLHRPLVRPCLISCTTSAEVWCRDAVVAGETDRFTGISATGANADHVSPCIAERP